MTPPSKARGRKPRRRPQADAGIQPAVQCYLYTNGISLERFERFQRIVRGVWGCLERNAISPPDADAFFEGVRGILLAGGATDRDLELVAICAVCGLAPVYAAEEDELRRHLQPIAEHLTTAGLTVSLTRDGAVVRVEFPGRPQVH